MVARGKAEKYERLTKWLWLRSAGDRPPPTCNDYSARIAGELDFSAGGSGPCNADLKPRIPSPIPLPNSGSFLGPNTSKAIPAINSTCMGWNKPSNTGSPSLRNRTPESHTAIGCRSKQGAAPFPRRAAPLENNSSMGSWTPRNPFEPHPPPPPAVSGRQRTPATGHGTVRLQSVPSRPPPPLPWLRWDE
jgi:hypothetical protein